jgi:hypothetical protein
MCRTVADVRTHRRPNRSSDRLASPDQMMSPRQSIVTGHFDDPRSRDCYWRKGYFGQGLELPPQELAAIECRFQFVVDSRTDA